MVGSQSAGPEAQRRFCLPCTLVGQHSLRVASAQLLFQVEGDMESVRDEVAHRVGGDRRLPPVEARSVLDVVMGQASSESAVTRTSSASSDRNQVTPSAYLVCRIRVSMRWARCGHLPCLSLMSSVFRMPRVFGNYTRFR